MTRVCAMMMGLAMAGMTAQAADRITGAFGLKFGDPFEPKTEPVSKYGVKDAYEFKPEKANGAFTTYLVKITPTTHRIYQIVAVARTPEISKADELAAKVWAVVRNKYEDKPTAEELVNTQTRALGDAAGSVSVDAFQAGNGAFGQTHQTIEGRRTSIRLDADTAPTASPSPTVYGCKITYEDYDLKRQGDAERFESKQKELREGVDATGL
ncbi:MAG: hypothetical protein QM796_06555 [Chthoniobacteraceae bacterium]